MRLALLLKGDFLLGVDLEEARFEAIDKEKHTAVLVLSQPRVKSPRVDHQRTRVYGVSTDGLWMLVPGDAGQCRAIDRAYEQAQRFVEEAAGDAKLIEQARRRAEQVLATFFAAMGWSVNVRWQSVGPAG
jgi:hypothetical protein